MTRYLELPATPPFDAKLPAVVTWISGAAAALTEYSRGRDSPVPFYAQPGINMTSGAAAVLDLRAGLVDFHKITLTDNCALSLLTVPRSPNVCRFSLLLRQDAGGGNTVTWWSGLKWAGGSAPTLSTAGNAEDLFEFVTFDGGVTSYGRTFGLAMS